MVLNKSFLSNPLIVVIGFLVVAVVTVVAVVAAADLNLRHIAGGHLQFIYVFIIDSNNLSIFIQFRLP